MCLHIPSIQINDNGYSDLYTNFFHGGARRDLQELCPVKSNTETYEI